jgi:hypothetical protein
MESRAAKMGMANQLFYMNPNNANWLKPDDAAKVEVSEFVVVKPVGFGSSCSFNSRHSYVLFSFFFLGA